MLISPRRNISTCIENKGIPVRVRSVPALLDSVREAVTAVIAILRVPPHHYDVCVMRNFAPFAKTVSSQAIGVHSLN